MNLRSLPYNQKIRLLIAGTVLLFLICFQYAFKKTWDTYRAYKENMIAANQSADFITLLPNLKNEEKKLASLINTNITDTSNSPKETLAFLTTFCKDQKMRLTEYQPLQFLENKDFDIATRQISVQGSFTKEIRLLYELENHQSFGKICSVNFKSTEDNSGSISLICTFYIQNLIPK